MISQNLYRMIVNVLARNGTDGILTQQNNTPTYDPTTGTYASTTTTKTVRVALVDYNTLNSGKSPYGETLIEVGDKQCYAKAYDSNNNLIYPSPTGDTLTVGGTIYRIVNVKEYNLTGSSPILYDLLLRK